MKKNKIYTVIILLLLGFMSCNQDNFFEIERPQETQWVSTVTFDQGLSAAYYDLFYYNHSASVGPMIDFASSGVAHLLPSTSTGAPWNEMNYRLFDQNYGLSDGLWTGRYRAITMCNLAIKLDSDYNGNPFSLKTDDKDYTDNYIRQVGEYYFLRAYSYYTLVRHFAPPYNHSGANDVAYIPLKMVTASSKEEVFSEKLGTNEEIYQQIISDLKLAKERLPVGYNSATMLPTYAVGRANKFAAAALLAKVYFVMGKYAEAKTELDFVIQAAEQEKRFILEEPIQAYNKNVITDISKEAIWEYNTGISASGFTSGFFYWAMIFNFTSRDAKDGGRSATLSDKSSWNQFTFSYWALDKMNWMTDPLNGDYTLTNEAANDLRFRQLYYYLLGYVNGGDPLVYEAVSSHSAVNTPQLYIDKYYRGAVGKGRYTKAPLIRLADLYLIRSWIKWKTNDPTAANDLNKVWNRANPDIPDRYNSGNVNHDAIFSEYLKEMSGEGWTLDFMVGTQMDIPPGDEDRDPIAPPYSVWKWAIPAAEKAANPNYQ